MNELYKNPGLGILLVARLPMTEVHDFKYAGVGRFQVSEIQNTKNILPEILELKMEVAQSS